MHDTMPVRTRPDTTLIDDLAVDLDSPTVFADAAAICIARAVEVEDAATVIRSWITPSCRQAHVLELAAAALDRDAAAHRGAAEECDRSQRIIDEQIACNA